VHRTLEEQLRNYSKLAKGLFGADGKVVVSMRRELEGCITPRLQALFDELGIIPVYEL
jgi:hypothetical protein